MDNNNKLASRFAIGKVLPDLFYGSSKVLFIYFCHLPPNEYLRIRQEMLHFVKEFHDPVGRLVQNKRGVQASKIFETAFSPFFMWKKAGKEKIVDRKRTGRECCGQSAWPRDRDNLQVLFMQGVEKRISRVADYRGSSIGDKRDISALLKQGNNLPDRPGLIIVMVTDQFFAQNIEMLQQN